MIMENNSKPRFNAFHYIIVGVLGFFAGSFAGFILYAAVSLATQPGNEQVLFHSILWCGILGAAGLPTLLRVSSS
jgi:hypothetical protein